MKILCVNCQIEMRVRKNGVEVLELVGQPQKPYALWEADKWFCPGCDFEVIAGFGQLPLWEQWHDRPIPEACSERHLDYERLLAVPVRGKS